MKHAKLIDKWRYVSDVSRYQDGIASICQYSDPSIHGSRESDFYLSGVNAIVGNNGAGKSSFFAFLTSADYSKVTFRRHDILFEDGTVHSPPKDIMKAIIVDPFTELKAANIKLEHFKTMIEAEGTYFAQPKELELINYVLASSYSEVGFTGVEVSEDEPCPYFEVTAGTETFDNSSLSQGEQLVLYIFWNLKIHNRYIPIVFLEEPEAGLSPSTQVRLLEMLVCISADDKKQIFISTHSPFIVQNLGYSRVILLKKEPTPTWYLVRNEEYLQELGMKLGKTCLFITEDNKGKVFLERLLDLYGSQMRRKSDILFVHGEDHIHQIMSRIDSSFIDLDVVGVFDGDAKAKGKCKTLVDKGRCLFLPGSKAPEQEIIDSIESHLDEYADLIGVRGHILSDAVRRLKGTNHHDFFEELSKDLFGEKKPHIYEIAFKIWFERFDSRNEVEDFVRTIDSTMDQQDFDDVNYQFPVK